MTPIESRLRGALQHLLELSDLAPEPNCHCHAMPPCGDCVEWGGLREARAEAEAALAAASARELAGAEHVALHNLLAAAPARYAPPYPDAATDPFNAVMDCVPPAACAARYAEAANFGGAPDPDAEAAAYAASMGDRWERMGEEAREAARQHVRAREA